ncbi:high affinity choline transporter 1-like isoform X2 [Amblyomma americanum]
MPPIAVQAPQRRSFGVPVSCTRLRLQAAEDHFLSRHHATALATEIRRHGKWVRLLLLPPPAVGGELFWTAAVLSALGSTVEVIVQLDARMAFVVSAPVTFFIRPLDDSTP